MQPLQLPCRQVGIGLGGRHLGLRLLDFLRPRAVAQPKQRLFAHADFRASLRQFQGQRARIQPRQYLPGPHAVAFLDIHFGDAVAAVEGQRYLADIDVAVERQAIGILRMAVQDPEHGGDGGQGHGGKNGDLLLHGRRG